MTRTDAHIGVVLWRPQYTVVVLGNVVCLDTCHVTILALCSRRHVYVLPFQRRLAAVPNGAANSESVAKGLVVLAPAPLKPVTRRMCAPPACRAHQSHRLCGACVSQFFDAFNPTSKTKRRAAFVKEMMRGAANALAFMHEAGVVHRSLGAPSLRVNTLGAWW